MKDYQIVQSIFGHMVARASTREGFRQALEDKEKDPSLSYTTVEWILKSGTKFGSLIWLGNGRWA